MVAGVAKWVEQETGKDEELAGSYLVSRRIPEITMEDFVKRLEKIIEHETPDAVTRASVWVATVVYTRKLVECIPGFKLTPRSCHRTVLAAMVLASKYVIDVAPLIAQFCRVAGVSFDDMRSMEKTALLALDFRLFISTNDFHSAHSLITAASLLSRPPLAGSPLVPHSPDHCADQSPEYHALDLAVAPALS